LKSDWGAIVVEVSVERVAIAVKSIESARRFFEENFQAEFLDGEVVEDQSFKYVPFQIGDSRLELLEATDEDSVISKFIAKRGEGIHHVTFEVADLDRAIEELEGRGVKIAYRHEYAPNVNFEGYHWREAFIHPKDAFGVLIHLAEKKKVDQE
jgi:methylmalonyl-CoA epimerase